MKKKPRYSDVKFDVSDLDLRKHRLKNKAPDKESKPCVNDMCPIDYYNKKYGNNCKDINDCPKYLSEKPESAWEMFGRLHRDPRYGIRFLSKLNVLIKGDCKRSIIYWIADTPEKDAKEIMQEIEKELEE